MPKLNQEFIRNSQILSTNMDGEVVMMDADQGLYFSLSSGVGASIWAALEVPVSVSQLVTVVCAEYDTTPESCRSDIEEFVAQLHEKQLVNLALA